MAYGDVGGPVTALIITCRTSASEAVDIKRGDAVKLIGPYEITNELDAGDRVFGQALTDCARNGAAVPVRVRGVCDFRYDGAAPEVDGLKGVVGAPGGAVTAASEGDVVGVVIKVNSAAQTLEALL